MYLWVCFGNYSKVVSLHAVETWGVEVKLHAFLATSLFGDEWSASFLVCCSVGKEHLTHSERKTERVSELFLAIWTRVKCLIPAGSRKPHCLARSFLSKWNELARLAVLGKHGAGSSDSRQETNNRKVSRRSDNMI